MRPLTGSVRTYAWGSHTALARLQGRPAPSVEPEAELWLGAHPAAPALVDGQPLTELIEHDPAGLLGAPVLDRFGPRLPFLLKVLAADAPLSLQAHPDAAQARAGFEADEALPPGAQRSFVDPYHKPELLVAVADFDALCGFRAPAASAGVLAAFDVAALAPVVATLAGGPAVDAGVRLRAAVEMIMRWPEPERPGVVAAVAASGRAQAGADEPAFGLAADLAERYPADIGVVLALLLNHVRLRAGDAVYMPAGNLHAYLDGVGVEIMAASDNVLRGGLTPKHVDVDALLRVLRYEVLNDPVLRPQPVAPGVEGWATPAAEFALVRADVGAAGCRLPGAGPRVLLCLAGSASCRAGASRLELRAGESAFVRADEPAVDLTAPAGATVYQASTPFPGSAL